jgi:phytoene desaturase
VYLCVSSNSDPGHAPEGCENWHVRVDAPPLKPGFEWADVSTRYADMILGGLARHGLADPRPHIRWMQTSTPEDFATNQRALGGAFHGYAAHTLGSRFRRPAMAGDRPGFVFAGGSTYPGGGIPQVVLSGQMAATALLGQLGKTPMRPTDARPG